MPVELTLSLQGVKAINLMLNRSDSSLVVIHGNIPSRVPGIKGAIENILSLLNKVLVFRGVEDELPTYGFYLFENLTSSLKLKLDGEATPGGDEVSLIKNVTIGIPRVSITTYHDTQRAATPISQFHLKDT